jgi:hypothetical protein
VRGLGWVGAARVAGSVVGPVMPEPKTKDYDVRAALVSALLTSGAARNDIRHELTLDTYSSGGRADVVLLGDTRIIGFELKSGSDVLDRCEAQCAAMDRAFDAYMVIADIAVAKQRPTRAGNHWVYFRDGSFTQHPEEHGYRADCWGAFDMNWLGAWIGTFASRGTAPMWMASTLWANEVCPLTGSRRRYAALEAIRENFTLAEVRRHTVKQLRARAPGKWDVAFWARYDDAAAAALLAA